MPTQTATTPEHFLVLTLNHKTISLKNLPDFSFDQEQLERFLRDLSGEESIAEIAGLCTCNRTEFFAAVHSVKNAAHAIVKEMANHSGYGLEAIRESLDVNVDVSAVEHFFRLVSGLESMVIGDAQILGQVKQTYQFAQSLGTCGQVFHQVFQRAFSAAKRVRKETGLGKGRLSISSLAVECATDFFPSLKPLTAAVIGAGKMGSLTAKYLIDAGIKELRIVNRSLNKSRELANRVGGTVHSFEDLDWVVAQSDLVVSATSAQEFLISKDRLERAGYRGDTKKLLIDIALPPDIDPSVEQLEGVTLIELETLRERSLENQDSRQGQIQDATDIVDEELDRLGPWPLPFHIDALTHELGQYADLICRDEFESLMDELPNLSPDQRNSIEKQMKRIAERIILTPRRNIRRFSAMRNCPSVNNCLAEIFAKECGAREIPLTMAGKKS